MTLLEGMAEAKRLGLPVAVHAESEEITALLSKRSRYGVRDFLASRPIVAELEAIGRACLFAGRDRGKLHIVHVSSGRGVALAAEARARGVDVERSRPARTICSSPTRTWSVSGWPRSAHRRFVRRGSESCCGNTSPVAPSTLSLRITRPRLRSGSRATSSKLGAESPACSRRSPFLLERELPLERIAGVLAAKPAERFRIPHKGRIAIGYDGDLTLVDLNHSQRPSIFTSATA